MRAQTNTIFKWNGDLSGIFDSNRCGSESISMSWASVWHTYSCRAFRIYHLRKTVRRRTGHVRSGVRVVGHIASGMSNHFNERIEWPRSASAVDDKRCQKLSDGRRCERWRWQRAQSANPIHTKCNKSSNIFRLIYDCTIVFKFILKSQLKMIYFLLNTSMSEWKPILFAKKKISDNSIVRPSRVSSIERKRCRSERNGTDRPFARVYHASLHRCVFITCQMYPVYTAIVPYFIQFNS